MEIQKDFSELLACFNAHDVDYAIVGGYALAFHGAPRYTGDIDILVRPESSNAERIVAALADFGFGSLGLAPADFTRLDQVVQLGRPPVRVDLITSITGVSWEQVEADAVAGTYGSVAVRYIGRQQLIQNKRSTGRTKDQADLESLQEE